MMSPRKKRSSLGGCCCIYWPELAFVTRRENQPFIKCQLLFWISYRGFCSNFLGFCSNFLGFCTVRWFFDKCRLKLKCLKVYQFFNISVKKLIIFLTNGFTSCFGTLINVELFWYIDK
ncbi:uncharacterized protein LOC132279189 [Cornus florida]|uniref:uncharacterized protein LOC132279189 n=1 Tax=Cornus florida TaxID=4283 RepID=UPI0028963A54|nr:uncharacterized protein LOC132279189 [Cornus florida]